MMRFAIINTSTSSVISKSIESAKERVSIRRNVQCPLTEAPCSDPECSVTHCRGREQASETEFRWRAERERVEWERAQERREGATRILRELAAEQGRPMPRGKRRESYITQIPRWNDLLSGSTATSGTFRRRVLGERLPIHSLVLPATGPLAAWSSVPLWLHSN
jgi:hypothetical protein